MGRRRNRGTSLFGGFGGRRRSFNYRDLLPYSYNPWWSSDESDESDVEVLQSISSSQNTDGTGQDNFDDEICYGSLRGNVVGLQYYRGTVNHNEMVALQREPHNKYDINAIKVNNVAGQQVGHIKRELARPLAFVLDKGLARVEGIVPFGQSNVYTMPVDLTLWGKPENQKAVVDKLKHNGFYLSSTPKSNNKSGASTSQDYSNFALASPSPRQTYLSPAEIKNELDNLYETLEEGDKTTEADPAQAVSTGLYPHQKQALHWMMLRENTQTLPPFWVERQKKYFNNVLNFTTDKRPESVKGGILADDMGLGKTLEVISLIVTNFVDKQPLAVPVTGLVRQNRRDKLAMDKAKGLPTGDSLSCTQRKSFTPVLKAHCSGVVGEKKLPQLPILIDDDDDTRTPEVSDYEDDVVVLDEKIMTSKDDPNFSPIQTNKKSKEKTVSSPLVSRRPKRKIKKPVKYNYSSDENIEETCESPIKRVKPNPDADRGKAPVRGGRGRKKGKLKVEESSNNQKKSNTNQDIDVDGKSQDKENRIDLTADKKNLLIGEPTKEALPNVESNTTTLPDLKELDHGTIVTKDCHDDLPDLENVLLQDGKVFNIDDSSSYITPDYSKPSLSETGPSTGRTPTTGPRCTLIVCPMSVLSNWLDQFEMHVHRNVHLNIYLYYGSSRTKKHEDLTRQDVVLTTYSTVAADFKGRQNQVLFGKGLNIYLYYGSSRTKKHEDLMRQDVVLTTYSTVAADFKKGARNPLKKVKWLRIVLDEGHTIKNPNAQQTKAICELDAERRWILSGTPIQNSMKDLWSLINFLKISPFTDRYWWRRTIERPLTHGNKDGLKRLQLLMGNISMRRTKTQKLNGKPIVTLPERHVYIEHVKFSDEEKAVYEAMQKDGKIIVSKYFKQGTLLHNYGDVLAILMRLRQLCCHPFLVAKAAEAVKETMAELEETGGEVNDELRQKLIAELEKTGGEVNDELRQKLIGTLMMVLSSGTDEECAICLDSLKSAVITQCAHVYCRACIESVIQSEKPRARCPLCRGELDANKLLEVPPEREGPEHQDNSCMSDTWKPSAKVDALMNALNKVRAEDSRTKSIVVSQFTSLLTLLEVPLTASGFSFVRLDGTMNSKARIQAIEQFSSEAPDSPTIILLSLKAGGVGINLTAASRVFLIDPAWNPASEEQCFDRCHRLGQKKDVVITKFIVEDSVEVRMLGLQEKKRKLMTGAFGTKQTAEQKRQDRINDIKTLFNF